MRYRIAFVVALLAVNVCSAAPAKSLLEDWHDPARDRTIPVKIYLPADLSPNQPAPAVFFSHGLGGSRDGASYFGESLARNGYVGIFLQHPGSDENVWKDVPPARRRAALVEAASAKNYILRIGDAKFAIDRLTELVRSKGHALSGAVDLDRLAFSGHSFGAQTTQAIAGQILTVGPRELSEADPRIKAAIIFSPSAPRDEKQIDTAFSKINIPCYHLTGTDDQNPISNADPKTRQIPYQKSPGPNAYLTVFKDGDHMLFGGRGRMMRYLPLIEKSTIAFLDAHLKGDARQLQWLREQFPKQMQDQGTFEFK